MAAFRKVSVASALVLMTLLGTGVASAAHVGDLPHDLGVITCNSVAVPPIVRAEGIAELVGDIVLTCTNVPPAAGGTAVSHLVTNLSVSLNVNVTNNLQGHPDAVLIINENNCTAPVTVGGSGIGVFASTPSCATATTVPPAAAPDQRFQDPMFGELASATRIGWNGIHFPVPGGPSEPFPATVDCGLTTVTRAGPAVSQCNPSITVLRITSMRGNASQLGIPPIEGVPFAQIQAFVSITGPNTIPVSNNVLNVAIPLKALLTENDLAVPGTGQLAATFAPLSTEFDAASGEPVPRFIDTGAPSPPGQISIDIKPGKDPNTINCRQNGLIPVAILTTSTAMGDPVDFDATTVDSSNVRFGPGAAMRFHRRHHIRDVDRDGDMDMLLHFRQRTTGIQCGNQSSHSQFTISEGFATAFKPLGAPSFTPGNTQVEAGYYAPDSLEGGGASQATRFLLRFFNIPEDLTVSVEPWLDCFDDDQDGLPLGTDLEDDDTDLLTIHALDCDGAGDNCDAADVNADGLVDVDIVGGFGTAVYEVENDDPIVNEDCTIPVWFESQAGDVEACLTGQTTGGTPIKGCDAIQTAGG